MGGWVFFSSAFLMFFDTSGGRQGRGWTGELWGGGEAAFSPGSLALAGSLGRRAPGATVHPPGMPGDPWGTQIDTKQVQNKFQSKKRTNPVMADL